MSKLFRFWLTIPILVFAVGCGSGTQYGPGSANGEDVPTAPPLKNRKAAVTSPERFDVKFQTSKGDFVVEVTRSWSPKGADQFYEAVQSGFYDDCRFFRVISGFMAQFGINGDPKIQAKWREKRIQDEPVIKSNKRGYLTFATGGAHSRTTQLFINLGDNSRLDRMSFPPFGRVIEGMDVVDSLYAGYGEGAPNGRGPTQRAIQTRGNAYLDRDFPKLDFIKKATILKDVSGNDQDKDNQDKDK
jgi:peptidyl-prolyl cis-trans isomerase A (cyclophilin A)